MLPILATIEIFGEEHELGLLDPDESSLVSIISKAKVMCGMAANLDHQDKCSLYVVWPWNGQSHQLKNDDELAEVWTICDIYGVYSIKFVLHYEPLQVEYPSSPTLLALPMPEKDDNDLGQAENLDDKVNVGDDNDLGQADNLDDKENVGDDDEISENDGKLSNYSSEDEVSVGLVSGDEYDTDEDTPEIKVARAVRGGEVRQQNYGNIQFHVGDVFRNIYHFREVLKDYVIQEGFKIKRLKNDSDRISCKCDQDKDCPWRVYAALMKDGSFMVKIYNGVHTCQRDTNSVEATSPWIANKLYETVKLNPSMSFKSIEATLRQQFHVGVSPNRIYRAKRRIMEALGGNHKEAFQKLYKYANIILETNRGAMAKILSDRNGPTMNPTFKRYFLSFPAQKQGFLNGCRRFIGVDGCHLKGAFKGILLAAVSMDANRGVFPLAVCVCEAENSDSWRWFLRLLYDYLGDDTPCTFMSDRQKGLIGAIEEIWPGSRSRFCARHIYANVRVQNGNLGLKQLFWKASRSANKKDFDDAMAEIQKLAPKQYEYLSEIPPELWSQHMFDTISKSDHVTNNMTESFNSWIDEYRSHSILGFCEGYRRKVMKRLRHRETEARRWETEFPPAVHERIEKACMRGRSYETIWCGEDVYEVLTPGRTFVVKLNSWHCDCGRWQVSGIPCSHVLPCLSLRRVPVKQYVHEFHTKEKYLITYGGMIHPIPDESTWPEVEHGNLDPPVVKRPPGRPRIARKREHWETAKTPKAGSTICGVCGQVGHNRRTCPTSKTPKVICNFVMDN